MINHRVQKYIEDHSFCSEGIVKRSWILSMKKVIAFHPSSGGNTAKRIFSTDTADIPIRMTGNGCILRPGFMKMDLKKKALQILRHIFMKPERMVLFLVTNTSATIWCRPSILQMNKLRFAEILPAQVFVRVIQNEL